MRNIPINKVAAANKPFEQTLGKALSSITKTQWNKRSHPRKGEIVTLYLLPSVLLKGSEKNLQLDAYLITEVLEPDSKSPRLTTREYIYKISAYENDDKKPLYEFHWHPDNIDPVTLEPKPLGAGEQAAIAFPHIHVRATNNRFVNLNKKHIPSGRVAIEDVLHFLISECKIAPNREDWEQVLLDSRKQFGETMR